MKYSQNTDSFLISRWPNIMSKYDNEYCSYLLKRSWKGNLYRKYWLYPAISRNIGEHERVLDVGCGIGDFLHYRPNTFGVDVNKKTVNYCKEKGFHASLMDIDILPFESSSFDCVVLDNVLEHILNPKSILQEIRRVLNDDGQVVIGVPGIKGFLRDPDHKVFYSQDGLIDCLADNGFTKIKLFYTPFKLNWLNKNISQYCLYGVFTK